MLVKTGTTKEILTIIGDAPFYFLPVLVAITASDHFKIDRFYAIVAAGVLMMPSLTALMTGSENVFLFGIPVVKASYSYSILPVILLIWLTSKFLPFLNKAFPKCLMDNLYPVVVLLIMSTLGILVVGPAATLVSTGIGSGIIINGDLFRGSHGWAGESGHMIDTVDGGIMCGCGNRGCFMSQISGRNMPKRLAIRLLEGNESVLSEAEELNGEALLKAYEAGDAVAIAEVDHMAKHLAVCVYNIYQLLNIDVFVFGGGLTSFGDALFGRMRTYFDEFDHIKFPVDFRFAELKKDFGIIGSAELIR